MAIGRRDLWDLERLRLFVAVSELGSLTRAAAALGVGQPTLSRQIARLEQACGGPLFLRTGRGVALSPLGERLLPRVKTILGEADELSAELDSSSTPSGDVRIGALPSLYLSVIVPLFEYVMRNMPDVRLKVFEGSGGQIDQWLISGYVDLGLPYRYGQVFTDAEPLVSVASYLIGAPGDRLTAGETVRFAQIGDLPLVLPGAPSSVRVLLSQLARRASIELNVVMEADSTQIQKAVASLALGYTVLPLHAVAGDLESGSLQAARIVDPPIDRVIALGFTSARPSTQATREVAKQVRVLVRRPRAFQGGVAPH